jgi:hypothetical protein
MIVPDNFNMIQNFETSTLKYKNAEDMEKTISEIIEDKPRINEIKKSACENSNYFSLESLQKYFTEEILNKVDEI